MTDLAKLHQPFPANDVEWRLQTCGKNSNGFWARALAYITNRAIMERLDEVCGAANWRNEYTAGPHGGVLCGISIRIGEEWVTKWDGAENTDIEAVKGGLSNAMKRAAVQWGIGRYLYNLEEGWATCHNDERKGAFHGQTKDKDRFSWDPPELPAWALPGGVGKPGAPTAKAPPREQPMSKTPVTRPAPPSEPNGAKVGSGPDLYEQELTFGKHKGRTWGWLLEHHPDYVEWALGNMDRLAPEAKEVLRAALELHRVPAAPVDDRPLTEPEPDGLPF